MLALLSFWLGIGQFPVLFDFGCVVLFEPLLEWCGIYLNDAAFYQSVGTDQLVVGRVINNTEDTGFAGADFRTPTKVSRFQSKGTVLKVSTTSANNSDTFVSWSKLGVGTWATKLTPGDKRVRVE